MAHRLLPKIKKKLIADMKSSRASYYEDNKDAAMAPCTAARDKMIAIRDRIYAETAHFTLNCTARENLNNYPEYVQAKKENDEAWNEWLSWLDENSPHELACKRREAKKMRRRSKKFNRRKIEVVDKDTIEDNKTRALTVEWGDWMDVGSLVGIKGTDHIGMVVEERNVEGYKQMSTAVTYGGYVQVMVNGTVSWYKRVQIRPLDD
jgi:hypothetical protein